MEKSKLTTNDVLEQLFDDDSDYSGSVPMEKKVKVSTLIRDQI